MEIGEHKIYELIGEEGFDRLVAAFYRQIPHDDILGLMYPANDLPGAQTRLRDFLIFRFGGPARYIESRGHPRLRMRHFPFAITVHGRDRWLTLMAKAFAEADLPPAAARPLQRFFAQTAHFLINTELGND